MLRWRVVLPAALVVAQLAACQILFGIEVREEAPEAGGGSAGQGAVGDAGPEIQVCDAAPVSAGSDFSCVTQGRIGFPAVYTMGGHFEPVLPGAHRLARFEICLSVPAVEGDGGLGACEDRSEALCESDGVTYFHVLAERRAHAEATWESAGGELTDGSMWVAPSLRELVSIGMVPLFSWSEMTAYAGSVGVEQRDDLGMLFVSTKDCLALLVAGVHVAASVQGRYCGVPFAVRQHTLPLLGAPTDSDGVAGVFNVDPGWVTVQAYLEDGCLVAEASIFVKAREITFVELIPQAAAANRGIDSGCAGGQGGVGGEGAGAGGAG